MRRETELPVRNESRDKHDGAPSATLSAGECVPVCITDTVADSSIVQSVTIFSGAPIVFKQSGSKEAVRTLNLKQKNHFGPSQRENSTARRLPKGRLDGGETSFRALGLNSWINGTLSTLRLVHPTPVQRSCIPAILQGRDVIGTSQTGSGKTAAFALPIIQLLSEEPYGVFCLCLTPTRELAIQVSDQFHAFSSGMTLRCLCVIGGVDIRLQATALISRPHVVVATPGRLMEHLLHDDDKRVAKCFAKLRILVLDEADRLLDPGFEEDLRIIMHNLPSKNRQTLLFSATLTQSICALQEVNMQSAFLFEAYEGLKVVAYCAQRYCFIPAKMKDVYLFNILDVAKKRGLRSIIVFTGTVRVCQFLYEVLSYLGLQAVALHAVKKQRHRAASLARFKSGEVRILVATDIASRGLDIPTVDLVINYDIPTLPRDYVHRVGRTARAGRAGQAVTLVTQHDVVLLHRIEELVGVQMSELPWLSDACVLREITKVFAARRHAKMNMSVRGGFDDHFRDKRAKFNR